jgi:hypothetical protein
MSLVSRILRQRARGIQPSCPVCNEAVTLETSKTNEDGKAIHEECYVARVCEKQTVKTEDIDERARKQNVKPA